MTSLELFAGAGGLAIGAENAGFRPLGLLDWNAAACGTLRDNRPAWNTMQADISKVDFGPFGSVDLLSGGCPCQPFSLGGKHQAEDDARDGFPHFVRALREIQPRAFVVENVKGLLRESFRNYFSYILLQLVHPEVVRKEGEFIHEHLRRLERIHTRGGDAGLHYNTTFRLLNAADYGVPQTRERVFLVGFRSDVGLGWSFPEPTHSADALVWSKYGSGNYWERHGLRPSPAPKGTSPCEPLFDAAPWRTVRDAIAGLPKPEESRSARRYPGHSGSPIDEPAKTLKAGVHGVPGGENMVVFRNGQARQFSVAEAARLQTFPDDWRFDGSWSEAMRQLGNAVPVKLAEVISTSIAGHLRAHDARSRSRGVS